MFELHLVGLFNKYECQLMMETSRPVIVQSGVIFNFVVPSESPHRSAVRLRLVSGSNQNLSRFVCARPGVIFRQGQLASR